MLSKNLANEDSWVDRMVEKVPRSEELTETMTLFAN